MCYNKMYASKIPEVGHVAVSRMGHDAGRPYIVAAVLNNDFVLCVDGNVRPIEKPKTKRIKHLKYVCSLPQAAEAIANGKLNDAMVKKLIKSADGSIAHKTAKK